MKRLDRLVQRSGSTEALSAGIGGFLIFGMGLCFSMEVIGNAIWLGIKVAFGGLTGMLSGYPLYRSCFGKTKEKYAPRILLLAADLSDQGS